MNCRQRIIIFVFLVLFGNHLSGQIRVVNLAGDYIKYYHATENVSDEQKLEYFNTMVFQKAPHVYERIFNDIKWIGQNPEERIITYHTGFASIESKFSNTGDTLAIQLSASLKLFQKVFPDFNSGFDVYVLHSLGIRAGGVVNIEGRDILMLGVEQIIKYFDFQNFSPFFHHEFTHLYHNIHYTPAEYGDYSEGAVYNHLWTEGLAVYISMVLNPGASQKEVFMRDSLSQETDEVLGIAIPDILENLYSNDKEIIRRYFWNSSTDLVIPKYAGYYIGYLLVKEIVKKSSLNELFQLKEDDFVPEFKFILENSFAQ